MTNQLAKSVRCPECGHPTTVSCTVVEIAESDAPVSVHLTKRHRCANDAAHRKVPDEEWVDAWRIS